MGDEATVSAAAKALRNAAIEYGKRWPKIESGELTDQEGEELAGEMSVAETALTVRFEQALRKAFDLGQGYGVIWDEQTKKQRLWKLLSERIGP